MGTQLIGLTFVSRIRPETFHLGVQLLTGILHNEPTSVGALVDMGLCDSLLSSLEGGSSFLSPLGVTEPPLPGLPTSSGVVAALPGAIGGFCLNSKGKI